MLQLISVNTGKAQTIENAKSSGVTGIFKQPVPSRVQITAEGLAGDTICDTKNHGGVDQAVYLYGTEDYAWWAGALGRPLPPGIFGENLTISGLASADYIVGDRFHVGSVILEVTAPRGPCVTLATRMGDPMFVKRFRRAERPGLYCRVIQEGWVQAGDAVRVEKYTGEIVVSVLEIAREYYEPKADEALLRRFLAAPIAIRERVEMEGRLERVLRPIHLRPLVSSDLPTLFEQQLDPEANHMAAFTAKDPTDRAAFDAHWAKIMADPGILLQTILYKGAIAGSILSHGWFVEPEISYWIGRKFWGKGIATEALRQFLEIQPVRPLYARAAKDNLGSIRVLEKNGFLKIGEEQGFSNARGAVVEEVVMELK